MLWFRLSLLGLLVLGPLVALIPTLCPACDVPLVDPSRRIHLGTDLQGGADLWFAVQVDSYVAAKVDEDAADLRRVLRSLSDAGVRRVGVAGVEITAPVDPETVERLVASWFGEGWYDAAGSDGGIHRFVLSERRQEGYREAAIEHAVERIRARVDRCVTEGTVERGRAGLIYVSMPGYEFDPFCG